jgi:hypothetical protein
MFILLFFLIMWNSTAIRWNTESGYLQRFSSALFTSEALLTTSGEPANWETLEGVSNVSTYGLVNGRNEISNAKIEKFVAENSSYESIKSKVGMQFYDFKLTVTSLGGKNEYYEFGQGPPADAESTVIERLGLLNESIVLIRLEVWG